MDDATRKEAIGLLIGDLGEAQAKLMHLVLDDQRPGALAHAVDNLNAAVESLRRAAADEA